MERLLMYRLMVFISICFVIGVATPASADMISGLYDTGVDSGAQVLAFDSVDPHWVLTGPTGTTAYVVPYDQWFTPPSGSNWIGPQTHADGYTTDPGGNYSYTLSFDLTGFDESTAVITGKWASDDASSIWLNGTYTGIEIHHTEDSRTFGELYDFSLETGFLPGINSLTFKVENWGSTNPGNPSGLLVANLQGTASPLYKPVDIDIKPGDVANCINLNQRGVIPVAIFGSDDVDVTQINVETLFLSGLSVKVVEKSNKFFAHYDYVDGDGYLDLVVQFQDSDQWVSSGNDYATITGYLSDGTAISGGDLICIVP